MLLFIIYTLSHIEYFLKSVKLLSILCFLYIKFVFMQLNAFILSGRRKCCDLLEYQKKDRTSLLLKGWPSCWFLDKGSWIGEFPAYRIRRGIKVVAFALGL